MRWAAMVVCGPMDEREIAEIFDDLVNWYLQIFRKGVVCAACDHTH